MTNEVAKNTDRSDRSGRENDRITGRIGDRADRDLIPPGKSFITSRNEHPDRETTRPQIEPDHLRQSSLTLFRGGLGDVEGHARDAAESNGIEGSNDRAMGRFRIAGDINADVAIHLETIGQQ